MEIAEMGQQISIPIRDSSGPGEARRVAERLAQRQGLAVADQGRVALVVTEAATNIVKHARAGEVVVGPLGSDAPAPGVEVLALDKGPGMANVARCLQDGYSTAGSAGTGLGAISRLSSEFDLHSQVGVGTAILARVWPARPPVQRALPWLALGAVCLPAPGEREPGDGWDVQQSPERARVTVVDGLGHGPDAARAAREAIRMFRAHSAQPSDMLLQHVHGALRSTRGAAMAVAEIDLSEREIRFAGVGNIAALVAAGASRSSYVCQNGTLGAQISRIRMVAQDWPEGACLIMHSDGLTSRWDLQRYNGLLGRSPSIIAAVLYRDFVRGRDDVTVVVAREREIVG